MVGWLKAFSSARLLLGGVPLRWPAREAPGTLQVPKPGLARRRRCLERPAAEGNDRGGAATLRGARERGTLEEMGTLPQRAPMGHGARGLQRERRRVELLHPRPGAFARLSLGRGRPCRVSDDHQLLCFSIALWNGNDPILKERLFGLTNTEGNHGEDVKEYYYYLDTRRRTHTWVSVQDTRRAPYPYSDLVETNGRSGRKDSEDELLDTGVFDDNRYSMCSSNMRRQSPDYVLDGSQSLQSRAEGRTLHVLATLWFRNTWIWWPARADEAHRAGRLGR